MRYLLITFIFLFVCIGLSAQVKNTNGSSTTLTKQDSINVFVKKRDAALDSIISKTSLKDFRAWLDESVSSKMLREGTMNDLWTAFVNAKLEEWVVKNKIIVPRN